MAVVGPGGCDRFVDRAFERWVGVPREHIVESLLLNVLGRVGHERIPLWIGRPLAGKTVNF